MTVIARSGPLIGVQQRLTELGRIRMGEKTTAPDGKVTPRKLTKFRLTSASESHLLAAVAVYGGNVRPWAGAPDEGTFEAYLDSSELDILIPPVLSAYTQSYEVWDRGGCTSRCDGVNDSVRGVPCDHPKDHPKPHEVTTRVSVMLSKVPGLGVWRLDTKGWNAAATLPPALEMLATFGGFVPAILRLEQRSAKVKRPDGKPMTKRFVVPVIDIRGASIENLLASGGIQPQAQLVEPGWRSKVERPAIGPGLELERFDFQRPALPAGQPVVLEGGAMRVDEGVPEGDWTVAIPETDDASYDELVRLAEELAAFPEQDDLGQPAPPERLPEKVAGYTLAEFRGLIEMNHFGSTLVTQVARILFPGGASVAKLSDAERLALYEELERRRAANK